MEALVKRFSTAAVGVQGSGWAWLGYDKGEDKLVVGATANQDPCSTLGLTPLCVLRCVLTRTRLLTRPTPPQAGRGRLGACLLPPVQGEAAMDQQSLPWRLTCGFSVQNVRPSYVKAIWEIVNWKNVSEVRLWCDGAAQPVD